MKPRILIAQDEPAMNEILGYILEKEGFEVTAASDGREALALAARLIPDLVILDRALGLVSGVEVCRQLRARSETRNLPVVMLTERGEDADGLRGPEIAADDTVVKPVSPSELLARIRAILRRAAPAMPAELLAFGGVVVDLASRRVVRDGRRIHLGPTEFRLLCVLMERPGRVFSREQLLHAVWGHEIYIEIRTVDVYIRRLRKALNRTGDADVIRTVRSAGYALDEFARDGAEAPAA